MAQAAGERVAYFNGRIVPERDVRVPFRDRGFKYGDAVFDTTRTFGHRSSGSRAPRAPLPLAPLPPHRPGHRHRELKRITEEVLDRTFPSSSRTTTTG